MKLSKYCAEFVGTFALVFVGCGSLTVIDRMPGSIPSSFVPIIFGLVVAAMIYAVGHISGAHFNPAVTFGFAVARHFPWPQVFLYWLFQIMGALLAIFFLVVLLPEGNSFGATVPHVSLLQAFCWEVILTFFLMFVIIAVATDTRAVGIMAGAAIGATVMFDAFVGGPVTGGSMNPARSLAPAIAEGRWHDLWIYLVAPLVGAAIAALFYEKIRCESKEDSNAGGCC
jgi:aquaporin NIP